MKSRFSILGVVLALLVTFAVPAGARANDLTKFVNPFTGTATGRGDAHPAGTFPGATMPFGMIQWGPDTTQSAENAIATKIGLPATAGGRGYGYGSNRITGFSLTHLSGAGCPAYGDFPFQPMNGRLKASPAQPGTNSLVGRYTASFSHRHEFASPGSYRVKANPAGRGSVTAQFAPTTRSAFGRFTYPKTKHATMLINAGGSASADTKAAIQVHPSSHEVTGSATSGYFCAQRNHYHVYFAARFDRGFRSYGTWKGQQLHRGKRSSSDSVKPRPRHAAQAGAFVTMRAKRRRAVNVQVGISFVSVAGAQRNLKQESRGRTLGQLTRHATAHWNRLLAKVKVGGAPESEIRTLYTDLYQAMAAPRTFSDVDRRYAGMDGQVHRAAAGHTEYADFSGWDIYRSQIQLLAMLQPSRTSDMVRSLLADYEQSGCLPKWEIAGGQTMEMIGDPADPIIASAATFGARNFSHSEALAAMLKGANTICRSPNNGQYRERQGLKPYLNHGYIPFEQNQQGNLVTSIFGSPNAVYGSASTTLEYAAADFSIAQFAARFAGDRHVYKKMMSRSANWKKLVNHQSHYLEPKLRAGGFPAGYTPTTGDGFAEGDSAQYSWGVPWNLSSLSTQLGGRRQSLTRLRKFLDHLNATAHGSHSPHAYLGNEPSLGTLWIFDWLRRPSSTQQVVRRAINRYYSATPGGYPGQNDLGELSSWYVMAALGFHPTIPGVGVLALDSPLFASETVQLPHGTLRISARGAAPRHPYIRGLTVDGHPRSKPWISYCALLHGAKLRFVESGKPHRAWGAARNDVPPSYPGPARRPRSRCGP